MLKQPSILLPVFFILTSVIVADCLSLSSMPKTWSNMDILEIQNFKNGFLETGLKIKRLNRTTFVIDGPVTLTEDISNVDMDMKFYYSSLGNNQYVLLPYKCQRKPICYYLEGFLRKYIYPELESVSNLPKAVADQPLCPLYMQKTYTIQGYYLPEDIMPRYFNPGTYKCEFQIYKANVTDVQQTLIGILKLY